MEAGSKLEGVTHFFPYLSCRKLRCIYEKEGIDRQVFSWIIESVEIDIGGETFRKTIEPCIVSSFAL